MSAYTVIGGKKLEGTYPVSGAKNAGPKLVIAAILSDQECILHNIPRISDTEKILEAINEMGGSASWLNDHDVQVNCEKLNKFEVPEVVLTARHAVLFIGATLARLGKVRIAKIGGDNIGKRPIDRLLKGLESLGGEITQTEDYLEISMPARPKSREYEFEKSTHTGTESLMLGSIFCNGVVTIKNAAAEPEIDNLIDFVNAIGAQVERTSEREIKVTGVAPLLGGGEGTSMFDRLEAATAIVLAIMNGDGIKIENAYREHLTDFEEKINQVGVELHWSGNTVEVETPDKLTPIFVKTSVHPGFMTDWQPIITMLLAYKGDGKSEIHEMIYEQRWGSLRELEKMGVKYELFQPHGYQVTDFNFGDSEYNKHDPYGAYVYGPTELKTAIMNSLDVRAGIDVLIAALFAKGESKINDPKDHILRGYENIVGKLKNLGADITNT